MMTGARLDIDTPNTTVAHILIVFFVVVVVVVVALALI